MTNVIIIGGGAADFFAAINLVELRPDLSITILKLGKNMLLKFLIQD